jgi:hypothetical protein
MLGPKAELTSTIAVIHRAHGFKKKRHLPIQPCSTVTAAVASPGMRTGKDHRVMNFEGTNKKAPNTKLISHATAACRGREKSHHSYQQQKLQVTETAA